MAKMHFTFSDTIAGYVTASDRAPDARAFAFGQQDLIWTRPFRSSELEDVGALAGVTVLGTQDTTTPAS
jgi:hypothetical protein